MQKCLLEMSREIPIFSLQKLCLIKISTNLCNNQTLLWLIMKCHIGENVIDRLRIRKSKEWEAVQATANEIISEICKCVPLQKMILEYLWPVSYRIMLWKFTYARCITNKFLLHIYWIDRGRTDNIRTAKYMIENENITIRRKFILTCKLCLSKEIRDTWNEMSKKDKRYFNTKYHDDYRELIIFWTNTMEGSDDVVEQYMSDALECAIKNKLLEAIKHLFSIMEKHEKYHTLKYDMAIFCLVELEDRIQDYLFLDEVEIEISYFLLSQIQFSDENQKILNSRCRLLSLSLLLHSAEYENLPIALQKEIEFRNLDTMLNMIFNMYHLGINQDNDYRTLFINSWRAISDSAKAFVATRTDVGTICVSILIQQDFPFLLKEGACEKVAEFTSSETTLGFHQEKWEFLHFLIEEGVATMSYLKNRLRLYVKSDKAAANRVFMFLSKFEKKPLQQDP